MSLGPELPLSLDFPGDAFLLRQALPCGGKTQGSNQNLYIFYPLGSKPSMKKNCLFGYLSKISRLAVTI